MQRASGRRGWTPLGAACVAACVVAACLGGAAPFRQEKCLGPAEGYEAAKRALRSGTRALRLYLRAELGALAGRDSAHLLGTPGTSGPTGQDGLAHPPGSIGLSGPAGLIDIDKVHRILEQVEDRIRCLESDVMRLDALDGWEAWRRREEARAARLVRRRLLAVQHPPHCRAARKLVCHLVMQYSCGLGCQVHHIAYCLVVALATRRTLVLGATSGWSYAPRRGWEGVFRPLSSNCTSVYNDTPVPWPPTRNSSVWMDLSSRSKVMSLAVMDSMLPILDFAPPMIPEDLAPRVVRFAREPAAWWAGQMLRYTLRLRTRLEQAVDIHLAKFNFTSPIVGVHVRGTDKLVTEASFHPLEEYMAHVQDYYDALEITRAGGPRQVYLASDNPEVFNEARNKYPHYQFIGDQQESAAASPNRRNYPTRLPGLLADLSVLVRADLLVATYSSNLGRMALELGDPRRDAISVDRTYSYMWSRLPRRAARVRHEPRGAPAEFAFESGDTIALNSNLDQLNDYAYGTNLRTNETGKFWLYKTTPVVEVYPFPKYATIKDEDD